MILFSPGFLADALKMNRFFMAFLMIKRDTLAGSWIGPSHHDQNTDPGFLIIYFGSDSGEHS